MNINNNKSKKVMNNRSVVKNTPFNNNKKSVNNTTVNNNRKNLNNKKIKYYPIKEVLTSGLLNGLGIKFDSKSIENYDKLLHNPVALKQMETGVENLTNVVVVPVVNNALGQMVEPLSEGIHKVEENVLNEAVSAIPVVGQGIEMGKYALGTGSAVLETANEVTNIAKDSVEQIQEKAAELNPLNQINDQIETAQNAVAETVALPIETAQNAAAKTVAIPITTVNNQVKSLNTLPVKTNNLLSPEEKRKKESQEAIQKEAQEKKIESEKIEKYRLLREENEKQYEIKNKERNEQNIKQNEIVNNNYINALKQGQNPTSSFTNTLQTVPQDINSQQDNRVKVGNYGGGAKILSRIKKSVKQFMGKNEFVNKKITKTSKNFNNMKGGTYNKNKNNIISQKGGQILSRINDSLKTFNNIS